MTEMRRPSQSDLERVVGHFLYYLSNQPDPKTGISPRTRLYGMLPVESKMLFPDVSTETITRSVREVIALTERQSDTLPRSDRGWRSYS